MKNIVCYGEVLWDVFPNHKKIGGAPLNVALRLQSLENKVSIITKIGEDTAGSEIKDFIEERGVLIENVQVDNQFKTGEVAVTLDENGSASYTINFPRAWDYIKLTESAKEITKKADAFIYGSLIARNDVSNNTLNALLKVAKYKVFDVNLRAPHYTIDILKHLMLEADFIKFNDEEIFEIAKALNADTTTLEETILFIASKTNTNSICVTRGGEGAILYYQNTFYNNDGYKVDVVDTVGAGDSFLASLIDKLLKEFSPQESINFACAMGALVASCEGANPIINQEKIENFIDLEYKK
ncbi:carbohydrate kinase family protein [Polaribacter sargassicola]|uniref:carbohydrate kinase family protein n=1 Tax=Polaribacter sargassicola TaxID=2836891 RepID=UPI001F2A6A0A|nr:carbohydrate kinase [Polaribacter sp. DS7-9]MCG1037596.1 carbohydrate kinase [Polaribacter sp. DS7-9]